MLQVLSLVDKVVAWCHWRYYQRDCRPQIEEY